MQANEQDGRPIRLARASRSVIVLEAAEHPGGAVRTEELTLPGFRHDTFSSVYPAAVLEDATVPRSRIAEMVEYIQVVAARHGLMIGTFGHARRRESAPDGGARPSRQGRRP